jgi:hypothetical protein
MNNEANCPSLSTVHVVMLEDFIHGAFGGRPETMNHLPTEWRSTVLGIAG